MTSLNGKDINFQEDGNKEGYVFVCKHIALKSRPVLVIEMNPPFDSEHSGWEAICNTEDDDCNIEDFVKLPIKDFLDYEPSLRDLLLDPKGLPQISRESKDSPWKVIQ